MHFVIIGRDATDPGALDRRMAARGAHIALIDKMVAAGKMLLGGALVDDAGKMCGSVIIGEFADRSELDAWLREEPYVTGKVWAEIEVSEWRIGPSFQGILEKIKGR